MGHKSFSCAEVALFPLVNKFNLLIFCCTVDIAQMKSGLFSESSVLHKMLPCNEEVYATMAVQSLVKVTGGEVHEASSIKMDKKVRTTPLRSPTHASFDESQNVHYANLIICQEDCKRLWYNAFEFQKMKEYTSEFIKKCLKEERRRYNEEKSYSNIILRVYDECCGAEFETTTSILCEEDKVDFTFLVRKANSRSGLERSIVRDLAYDKRFRRTEVVTVVLKIQEQHKAGEAHSQCELMRLSAEAITRPSRIFARHLGSTLEVSLR